MAMDFSKSKGSNLMRDIQKKSVEQGEGIVAINIPLDEIDENPDNSKIFNMEGIESLADGIKREGFIGAIYVFKKNDGRYEISSGHRRYRAMRLLGEKTIPCIVEAFPADNKERMLKLISSNIRNRDMKPMDWARCIQAYIDLLREERKGEKAGGDTRQMAAEYFQMASSNIQRYTALLKLVPELQKYADNPEYSFTALSTAASLTEDEQYTLLYRMQDELSKMPGEMGTKTLSKVRIIQLVNDIKGKTDNTAQKNKSVGNFVTAAVESEDDKAETGEDAATSADINPEDFVDEQEWNKADDIPQRTAQETGSIPARDSGSGNSEGARQDAGYYTEFKKGNPLVGGEFKGALHGDDVIERHEPKDLFGGNYDDSHPAFTEERSNDPFDLFIHEVENIVSADVDIEKRDALKAKVERLEKAISELKKKYVL